MTEEETLNQFAAAVAPVFLDKFGFQPYHDLEKTKELHQKIAKRAYKFADIMMKEKERRKSKKGLPSSL